MYAERCLCGGALGLHTYSIDTSRYGRNVSVTMIRKCDNKQCDYLSPDEEISKTFETREYYTNETKIYNNLTSELFSRWNHKLCMAKMAEFYLKA